MAQEQVQVEGASVAELMTQAFVYAYEQGWTDGLPSFLLLQNVSRSSYRRPDGLAEDHR
jgi:hypothetical protein